MQFSISIGTQEKHQLELRRNWFTGALSIKVNGQEVASLSHWDYSTHMNFDFTKRFNFETGESEKLHVIVEIKRPMFMGGIRPHIYKVYVNEQLIHTQRGY